MINKHYSLHKLKVKGGLVKDVEELLETLDKLIVEENYLPKQIFNMDETYSGNGCLKGLSSVRRPGKCQAGQDNFSWGQCCCLPIKTFSYLA
jgi:hypothetical protein